MDTLAVIEKPFRNVSYLSARDPSIITWGPSLENVRENLITRFNKKTGTFTTISDTDSNKEEQLQVYLRIKKAPNFQELYEIINARSLLCKVPVGAFCSRNMRDGHSLRKVFEFSNIFGAESTQTDVFNNVVKKKVLDFMNGINCNLLTYGTSGSGKTFTIIGTPEQPGILPRALEYMFRTLPKLPEHPKYKPTVEGGIKRLTEMEYKLARIECVNFIDILTPNLERLQHKQTYRVMQERLSQEPVALIMQDIRHVNLSVWISFVEIYNEHVFDLLKQDSARSLQRPKLQVGYSNGTAYIKGLTSINVSSGLEAYYILQYGLRNLNYAATTLNDHSSRSHSIFTIKLAQASDTQEGVSVSYFNFCDLAGSERMKKTNHVGERLKESKNINKSLLTLGRCISLVRESQKKNENLSIPFRDSKLTQLFQRGLQGLEPLSMIVNVNPSREMFDESQHVLNFSAIAKEIVVEKQAKVVQTLKRKISDNTLIVEYNSEKRILLEQIDLLTDEVEQRNLDFAEERKNIIDAYREMLDDNNKMWQERYNKLRDEFSKNNDTSPCKKRKVSIINLDSSEEDASPKIDKGEHTFIEIKCELEAKNKALSLSKEKCRDFEMQIESFESQLRSLEAENIKLKEQLTEAEDYIQATLQTNTETTQEKENVVPNN